MGIPGESTCLSNWNLYICSLKYSFKSLGVWLCIVSTVGAYIDTCSHLRPHTCQRQTWCWWPAGGRAETVLGKPGCGTAGEGYVEWSSALQLTRTQQWYSTPHIQPETHERIVQWSYTKNNSTFSSRVQHIRQQAPRRKPHVTMSTRQTHETCWQELVEHLRSSPNQTHLKPLWTLMATSRVFNIGLTSMYSSIWSKSKRSVAWKWPGTEVILYPIVVAKFIYNILIYTHWPPY